MGCMLPQPVPPTTPVETATRSLSDGESMSSSATTKSTTSTSLELPNRVVTATHAPLRTTIVRDVSGSANSKAGATPDASETNTDTVQKALKPDTATEPEAAEDVDPKLKEVTNTFYSLPLSGFHGAALPLITTNGDDEPISLIAYANASLFGNFISSGLVDELGLSRSIVRGETEALSEYIPERDLSTLFGYRTRKLGIISLDVLAGRDDRLVGGIRFGVFEAPLSPKDEADVEGGVEGWWKADVVVGMRFLNRVQGIRLTEEFSGLGGGG
ncbi:hypothetical protein OHC33_002446 [Knufia fluminis]|uniref:Uncharacterized protein n=2 Tax=Knufia TaxID=430999 RepID=A0AAN8I6L6_9EURO|nr:hypothetical protein OHC33_002446 [Knufia fluminis]